MAPILKTRVQGKLIQGIDKAVLKYMLKPPGFIRKRSSPEGLDHDQRILAIRELTRIYLPQNSPCQDSFFKSGQDISTHQTYKGQTSRGLHITDMTWPSRYLPFWQDKHLTATLRDLSIDKERTLLEKFYDSKENLLCHARRFRKDPNKPRPTIICLHGYGGGTFSFENWAFTVNKISDHFDVILMVLPHHSYRKNRSRRYLPPRFPSADPRFTIEALRQVYFDYQGLKDHLHKEGVRQIGLVGISLGGYCTALIAALDPDHEFFIPIVPLGRMSDLAGKQARFKGDKDQQMIEKKQLDRLFSPVDPTSYNRKLGDKMTIIAGKGDGITGLDQAQILHEHFDAKLESFEGGHIIRTGFESAWEKTILSYAQKI